jgi:hypothetical protein
MNTLNHAIEAAFQASGNSKEANKVYLEFLKANFIIPIEQHSDENNPVVLFLEDESNVFLPVFTEMSYLDAWAQDIGAEIKLLKLSGLDLLKGVGDQVTICLDIGSPYYKEFNPMEVARMKGIVLKFFKK